MPRAAWAKVLGGALALAVAFAAILELRLALRGFRPSVADSEARWIAERERASALGTRALILVGGSRMQVDADLGVLRRRTGLAPVQLSIDGTNALPVFRDLASDETITGTVIVDYYDHHFEDPQAASPSWQLAFERRRDRLRIPNFDWAERHLANGLHGGLRSYADGARPLNAVLSRLLATTPTPQYLVTLPNRERLADYSRVRMQVLYYARVEHDLGLVAPLRPREETTWADVDAELSRRIAALKPRTEVLPRYDAMTAELAAASAHIRERGGRVYFFKLPMTGLVRAIDEHRYPRAQFWNRFAEKIGVPAVHFADVPALQHAACPDGSHLDYRDRARFTDAMVDALGLARPAP